MPLSYIPITISVEIAADLQLAAGHNACVGVMDKLIPARARNSRNI